MAVDIGSAIKIPLHDNDPVLRELVRQHNLIVAALAAMASDSGDLQPFIQLGGEYEVAPITVTPEGIPSALPTLP